MGHKRQGFDDGVAKVGASMVTNASDVLIPYESLMRSEIYITFMEGIGVIPVTFRKLTTYYVIPRLPSALLLATSAIFLHLQKLHLS